jgi:glutamate dehydrogenase (NADP+)
MGGGKVELILIKGKSDNEVMRFVKVSWEVVQTYRTNTDVPAGDIGVGGRVGFMFGQYKRLRNEFTGF